jgi:hypothetical protein
MQPADSFTPEQLLGKRVAFKDDAEHAACWHRQVGLKGGVVLRRALSLAQKAQMVAAEIEIDPELFSAEEEVPRVWVKADPCDSFPRGCETAVEKECLLVLPSKPGGGST